MRLKIFNLNCWLLPPPLSVRNHKRLLQIISLIEKYHPDVITLQEVWLKRYVGLIEKMLPDYFFIRSNSRLYNSSGLVTGVLKKYESFKTQHFPLTKNHSLPERIARKGYHLVEVHPYLFIINAHLYTAKQGKHMPIVRSQFRALQEFSRYKDCILVGDLNLKEDDLRKLNTVFSLYPSDDMTVFGNNPYMHILFKRHLKARKRIDYILKTKNSRIQLSMKCLNTPILSDHKVMLCTAKE